MHFSIFFYRFSSNNFLLPFWCWDREELQENATSFLQNILVQNLCIVNSPCLHFSNVTTTSS
jgi:hypothetical protein